jgi:hypothetical protein
MMFISTREVGAWQLRPNLFCCVICEAPATSEDAYKKLKSRLILDDWAPQNGGHLRYNTSLCERLV